MSWTEHDVLEVRAGRPRFTLWGGGRFARLGGVVSRKHVGRPYDADRLDRIAAAVRQWPGSRQVDIARAVGCAPCAVYVALPLLEERGILLAEDDDGRLYFFGEECHAERP